MKTLSLCCLLVCLFLVGPSYANLPQSKEAILLDSTLDNAYLLEAKGIYYSKETKKRKRKKDVKKHGVSHAVNDAKKAAVYYLLYSGPDPLLTDSKAFSRFSDIQDLVFSEQTINKLISAIDESPSYRISLDKGQGVKVAMNVKVDRAYLRLLLEDHSVIEERSDYDFKDGYPFVVLFPIFQESMLSETNKMQLLFSAAVAESFLSSKTYDVLIPEKSDTVNDHLLSSISETESVSNNHIALNLGSDLYLDMSIKQIKDDAGADMISLVLSAYESSSGRLLASETGVSLLTDSEVKKHVESATLSALEAIHPKLLRYWDNDIKRGVQYRVMLRFDSEVWSDDKKEQVFEDIYDSIRVVSSEMKEKAGSDTSLDVNIWVPREAFDFPREVFSAMRQHFISYQHVIDLHLLYQNNKVMIIDVK